jgi:hypothetical protein
MRPLRLLFFSLSALRPSSLPQNPEGKNARKRSPKRSVYAKPFDYYADNAIAKLYTFEKACMRNSVIGHHHRGASVWI